MAADDSGARTNSRTAILRLLCVEPHTTAQLAAELGVSTNAVRKSLLLLEADGQVRYTVVARGVGKPVHEYEITRAGESSISRAYLPLLRAVLDELQRTLPTESLEALLRQAGRLLSSPPVRGPLRSRLAATAAALNELGGDASVSGTTIECQSCAIASVVADQPLACKAMEAFVTDMIGTPAREACDRSGRPKCRFAVA